MGIDPVEENVNELNPRGAKIDNKIYCYKINKIKVMTWIADRVDGKEHFLSFYRPEQTWHRVISPLQRSF